MRRAEKAGPSAVARGGAGFTLVELLVVIALPSYFHAVYSARVRGCQSQITVMSTACEAFFARNRMYPNVVEEMCESTAPAWVVAPPLEDVPTCPFGVPYEILPLLKDGTVGGSPSVENPQVGVVLNSWDHFDGPWKRALNHKE